MSVSADVQILSASCSVGRFSAKGISAPQFPSSRHEWWWIGDRWMNGRLTCLKLCFTDLLHTFLELNKFYFYGISFFNIYIFLNSLQRSWFCLIFAYIPVPKKNEVYSRIGNKNSFRNKKDAFFFIKNLIVIKINTYLKFLLSNNV